MSQKVHPNTIHEKEDTRKNWKDEENLTSIS